MKVRTIPSGWLRQNGRRFDPGPYLSGAIEAKVRLERLACRKDRLADLTAGHEGGIYNGPHFSRRFVTDPRYGVPFLGSASMLRADLSNLPLLRKKDAYSPKLVHLRVRTGMTLISCSGTIGRMVYARPDMDGMWSSQHIMKVVPDPEKVPPGYLYAFLSSKYGVPLVTSGTYGAIIQHIEPEHIADLPVARLGAPLEQEIHELVSGAASKRSAAIGVLNEAGAKIDKLLGPHLPRRREISTSVRASLLQSRLDAYYYSERCQNARYRFDTADCPALLELGDVAEVFIPGIFKRRYADDPSYGTPYITGADVFQLAPTSDRYLMNSVVDENRLAVKRGAILVQEAGQLGGLIGRSVYAGRYLDGFAVSNNMVRITTEDNCDSGFLYALLSCPEGVTLLAREAAGSSIPHMDADRLRRIRIPWPRREVRMHIGELVLQAVHMRDHACEDESSARALLQRAIEEAT